MRKDTILRFIIWLIITISAIVASIIAVIYDGRAAICFIIPVISFFFLPEVFKER